MNATDLGPSDRILKVQQLYNEWRKILDTTPKGAKWPYSIQRKEIEGLMMIWKGYLRLAGMVE